MRWTNYFLHPADNQLLRVSYNEDAHEFELALKEEDILLKGVRMSLSTRTHFNEALRQNHLLHAEIRKPFIENKGLRWTILILTGRVVAS